MSRAGRGSALSGRVPGLPDALSGRVLGAAGLLFCAAWAVAIVLFPMYKSMPVGYLPIAMGLLLGAWIGRQRAPLTAWMLRPRPRTFLLAISAAGLLLRVAASFMFPLAPANDHEMFYRLAASVAAGDGYAWQGRPTAFFPPGMPLLLALVFGAFGTGPIQAKVLGLVTGAALVPVSYWFARRVSCEAVARWTSVLVALEPTLVVYSVTIGYESLLSVLVMCWSALTERAGRDERIGVRRLVALGLISGAGTLIKPICLLLPALSLVTWAGRRSWPRAVGRAALVTVVMAAVVTPWTLRNWMSLGHPVAVSTNGGVVLYAANRDGSDGLGTYVPPLPGETDEVSRDTIRRRAAIEWIVSHPVQFAALGVEKAAYGWGTSSSIMSYVSADRMPARQEDAWKAALNVGWAALFLWCGLGALRTRIWTVPALRPALLFVMYLAAIHLVYEALSRHHITVLPILCITAGAWLAGDDRRVPAGG